MTIRRVAVLGAGAGGQVTAAVLSLIGYSVNLFDFPEFGENLRPIREQGGIELICEDRNELLEQGETYVHTKFNIPAKALAKLNKVTADLDSAVKGVDLIIVVMQTRAHRALGRMLVTVLEDDQIVLITPGSAGSLFIYNEMVKQGSIKDVIFAETTSLQYGCRKLGPGRVKAGFYSRRHMGVFPAKLTQRAASELRPIYDTIPLANILHAGLLNTNTVFHPVVMVLNTGGIENLERWGTGEIALYATGMTPSVYKVCKAVDSERLAICRYLGYEEIPMPSIDRYQRWVFQIMRDSINMGSRFLTEDVPEGLVFLSSVGRATGIPTPIIDSIITISCEINGIDYRNQGRTVEVLGLDTIPVDRWNEFLYSGLS